MMRKNAITASVPAWVWGAESNGWRPNHNARRREPLHATVGVDLHILRVLTWGSYLNRKLVLIILYKVQSCVESLGRSKISNKSVRTLLLCVLCLPSDNQRAEWASTLIIAHKQSQKGEESLIDIPTIQWFGEQFHIWRAPSVRNVMVGQTVLPIIPLW